MLVLCTAIEQLAQKGRLSSSLYSEGRNNESECSLLERSSLSVLGSIFSADGAGLLVLDILPKYFFSLVLQSILFSSLEVVCDLISLFFNPVTKGAGSFSIPVLSEACTASNQPMSPWLSPLPNSVCSWGRESVLGPMKMCLVECNGDCGFLQPL